MDRTFSIISHRREWVFPMAKDARHLFTSDSHYDHGNIIKYSSRPFLTEEETQAYLRAKEAGNPRSFKVSGDSIRRMNRTLIDRFNEVARPQDILWHLGDVAWNGVDRCREFFDALLCKNIILIWGNHDEPEFADLVPKMKARPKYKHGKYGPEQEVLPCYDQAFIVADGQSMHLNHYPGDSWEASHKGVWHLYGHVHGAKNRRHLTNRGWALSVDVGVDSHGFYPWTMDQLRALMVKRQPDWQSDRFAMKDKEEGGMTPVEQLS